MNTFKKTSTVIFPVVLCMLVSAGIVCAQTGKSTYFTEKSFNQEYLVAESFVSATDKGAEVTAYITDRQPALNSTTVTIASVDGVAVNASNATQFSFTTNIYRIVSVESPSVYHLSTAAEPMITGHTIKANEYGGIEGTDGTGTVDGLGATKFFFVNAGEIWIIRDARDPYMPRIYIYNSATLPVQSFILEDVAVYKTYEIFFNSEMSGGIFILEAGEKTDLSVFQSVFQKEDYYLFTEDINFYYNNDWLNNNLNSYQYTAYMTNLMTGSVEMIQLSNNILPGTTAYGIYNKLQDGYIYKVRDGVLSSEEFDAGMEFSAGIDTAAAYYNAKKGYVAQNPYSFTLTAAELIAQDDGTGVGAATVIRDKLAEKMRDALMPGMQNTAYFDSKITLMVQNEQYKYLSSVKGNALTSSNAVVQRLTNVLQTSGNVTVYFATNEKEMTATAWIVPGAAANSSRFMQSAPAAYASAESDLLYPSYPTYPSYPSYPSDPYYPPSTEQTPPEDAYGVITFSGTEGIPLPKTVQRKEYSFFAFPVSEDMSIRIADAYYKDNPSKKVNYTVTPYGFVTLYGAEAGDVHFEFETETAVESPYAFAKLTYTDNGASFKLLYSADYKNTLTTEGISGAVSAYTWTGVQPADIADGAYILYTADTDAKTLHVQEVFGERGNADDDTYKLSTYIRPFGTIGNVVNYTAVCDKDGNVYRLGHDVLPDSPIRTSDFGGTGKNAVNNVNTLQQKFNTYCDLYIVDNCVVYMETNPGPDEYIVIDSIVRPEENGIVVSAYCTLTDSYETILLKEYNGWSLGSFETVGFSPTLGLFYGSLSGTWSLLFSQICHVMYKDDDGYCITDTMPLAESHTIAANEYGYIEGTDGVSLAANLYIPATDEDTWAIVDRRTQNQAKTYFYRGKLPAAEFKNVRVFKVSDHEYILEAGTDTVIPENISWTNNLGQGYTYNDFAREFIVVENILRATDDGVTATVFSTEADALITATIRLLNDRKIRNSYDIDTNTVYRVVSRNSGLYHIEPATALIEHHTLVFNDNGWIIGTDGTDLPEGFSADARVPLGNSDFFMLGDNSRGSKKLYVATEFPERISLEDVTVYKTSNNDYILKAGTKTKTAEIAKLEYALRPVSFVMYSSALNQLNNEYYFPTYPNNPYNQTVLATDLLTGSVVPVTLPTDTNINNVSPTNSMQDGRIYEATDGQLCMKEPFTGRYSYPYTYESGVKAAARYYNSAAGFMRYDRHWFRVDKQVTDRVTYITEKLTALGATSVKILAHDVSSNTLTRNTADIEAFNSGENVTVYYAIRTSGEATAWLVSGVDLSFTLGNYRIDQSAITQQVSLILSVNDLITLDSIRFKVNCDAPLVLERAYMFYNNGSYYTMQELSCTDGVVSWVSDSGISMESSLVYFTFTVPANTAAGTYYVTLTDLQITDGDYVWDIPETICGSVTIEVPDDTVYHKVTQIILNRLYSNGQWGVNYDSIRHGDSYSIYSGYVEDNAILYNPTTMVMGSENIPGSIYSYDNSRTSDDQYRFSIPSVTDDITVTFTEYAITFEGPDGLTLPFPIYQQSRYSFFQFPVSYDKTIRIADAYYTADPTKKVSCTITPYGYVTLYDAAPGDIHIVFEEVSDADATITLTVQPESAEYFSGETAQLSVTASASAGTLRYQWYENIANSKIGIAPIPGATDTRYSPSTASVRTKYYYAVITAVDTSGNILAQTVSDVAEITVKKGVPAEIVTKPMLNPDFSDADIPEALKQLGMATVEKLEQVMKTEIQKIVESAKDLAAELYDIILIYSEDGGRNWIKADKEHFPKDGRLPVTIPVPAGTSPETHNYTILHMFTSSDFGKTPGDMENPTYTTRLGSDGVYYLDFYVTGLSPTMIAWTEKGTTYTISGKITSVGTGDITVTLIQDGKIVRTVSTDPESGEYLLENIPAGTYTLRVSKAKHVTREYIVTVPHTDNGV